MFAPIRTVEFQLHSWQIDAVNAWVRGTGRSAYTGTIEIFTGGGKTLVALQCAATAAELTDNLRLVVVVPTEALLRQWIDNLTKYTNIPRHLIGALGAGGDDDLSDRQCLVCVLNSAAKKLPHLVHCAASTMLVVDECHRAGAPTFARVLDTPARFRLGLSATPDREEIDEEGLPVQYDEQLVGRGLGGLVYRFSLRDARAIGWLPEYRVHHHAVELLPAERQEYEEQSRRVDDLADSLGAFGVDTARARQASARQDEIGAAARAYVAATARRKDLLYRASERGRVAEAVIRQVVSTRPHARVLVFHERVDETVALYEQLVRDLGMAEVALEHSRLPTAQREQSLERFRRGQARVLVSVKSLVEGIDVPEADVGISVASSSSVRQRVQSLGRVLRRSFNDRAPQKVAEMHVVYVAATVDETIYAKEDWSDLTGEEANLYWVWSRDPAVNPVPGNGPPRQPLPTEEQEWARLGSLAPASPQPWRGSVPTIEYSVDVHGNVTTAFGSAIANAQGVDAMVAAVRGRPGGRFFVTPTYRLVLVRGGGAADNQVYVVGRLNEPFAAHQEQAGDATVDPTALRPGDAYAGPLDKVHGSYKLGQKRGGVIERRVASGRVSEFALTDGDAIPTLRENARRVLDAWKDLAATGMQFHVNSLWHAWYLAGGEPRYLARVEGGFAWPSDAQ